MPQGQLSLCAETTEGPSRRICALQQEKSRNAKAVHRNEEKLPLNTTGESLHGNEVPAQPNQTNKTTTTTNQSKQKKRLWGQNLSWKMEWVGSSGDWVLVSGLLLNICEALGRSFQAIGNSRGWETREENSGLNKVECLFPQLTLRRMPKQLVVSCLLCVHPKINLPVTPHSRLWFHICRNKEIETNHL